MALNTLSPLSPAEARRAHQLAVNRRWATGLLAVVGAIFVVSTIFAGHHRWLLWIQTSAVASLVGGLADWFAVTALFRRPLRLPIPHTAIIVERKDRFAETLGSFIQEHFLSADAVLARLTAADALGRGARWLAEPAHAERLAARAAEAVVEAADLVNDEEVRDLLASLVTQRLDNLALAPLAGRGLETAIREDRHQPLIDAILGALAGYLDAHGSELHTRLGRRSPWWLPGTVEGRVVNRFVQRSQHVLADMSSDRDHPLRIQIDSALRRLADDLQTSEELRRRGEELKDELVGQPELRAFASAVWADAKLQLRAQATVPDSPLRQRMTAGIAHLGVRLRDDPLLRARTQRALEATTRSVLSRFEGELAALVSGTIARWDTAETSRRLELLLGPDLQYIRINGTVFGALAGLALHALSRVL